MNKLYCKILRNRMRARVKERALKETLSVMQREVDTTDLSMKEGALLQERQSLSNMAHNLYQSYIQKRDPYTLRQLRKIFGKVRTTDLQIDRIDSIRNIILSVESLRQEQVKDALIEQSILDHHYRQIARKWMSVDPRKLSKKIHKVQRSSEMMEDIRQEYGSFLSDCVDNDGDSEERKDSSFVSEEEFGLWLSSLANYTHSGNIECDTRKRNNGDSQINLLEERITNIRNKSFQ